MEISTEQAGESGLRGAGTVLEGSPNLAPSQQELADKTGIDISSVNDAIALLEMAGYVGKLGRVPRSLYIIKKMPRAKVS
jgi:DNA-binding transcriptional regulator YhcF (GntR family)